MQLEGREVCVPAFQSMPAEAFYAMCDPICDAGFERCYNPSTKVWDRQLMDKEWRGTAEFYPTEDLTSTAICLIGASRAGVDLARWGIDPAETLQAMVQLQRDRDYPGGFGLTAWANAVWSGVSVAQLARKTGVALTRVDKLIGTLTTMETSWLLSGLCHEYARFEEPGVKDMVDTVARELVEVRFVPETRIVSHAGDAPGLTHGLRRWIANFADQIYTVQSLSFASMVTGNESYKDIAAQLAGTMVELQGDKGQWWWHYDAKRGGSPQPYSVYSVHQHGMAPMALRALQAAGGPAFEEAIVMSRSWLDDNELSAEMVDTATPTLWRSLDMDQNKLEDGFKKAQSLLGIAGDKSKDAPPKLMVNHECRPYEYAWCAYAGAIERGREKGPHLV